MIGIVDFKLSLLLALVCKNRNQIDTRCLELVSEKFYHDLKITKLLNVNGETLLWGATRSQMSEQCPPCFYRCE